jgi:glycerol uptake facilitator-like aquaporin
MIFLALAYHSQYQKISRLIKGITLQHVLYACYVMSAGAGACMNPALGLAQTVYWVGLSRTDGLFYDATLIWVYMTMPFIGAILAYVSFDFYMDITKKFEVKGEEHQENNMAAAAGPPPHIVPSEDDRYS